MVDLIKIITSPTKVFDKEKKPWLPLVATVIISIIGFLTLRTVLANEFSEKALKFIENLPEEQKQRALDQIGNLPRMLIVGVATIIILTPLKILIQALIFNTAAPLMGGELSFPGAIVVMSFANYISSLSWLIKVPIAIITREPVVRTDLGVLFTELKGYLPIVLSQIDIFTIWSLIIIAIGLEKYAKIERKKGYILVLTLWIIYIAGLAPLLAIRRA
ncbi:MAG: YIP1 family protein [candidate division WOR-3 bacterium]